MGKIIIRKRKYFRPATLLILIMCHIVVVNKHRKKHTGLSCKTKKCGVCICQIKSHSGIKMIWLLHAWKETNYRLWYIHSVFIQLYCKQTGSPMHVTQSQWICGTSNLLLPLSINIWLPFSRLFFVCVRSRPQIIHTFD